MKRMNFRLFSSLSSSLRRERFLHFYVRGNEHRVDNEYQILQRSSIPTMHFQDSLPRCPIPDMNKMCNKYLEAQRIILSKSDYEETEKIIKNFRGGVGKELHAILESTDFDSINSSYIMESVKDKYLRNRSSLVGISNPGICFTHEFRDAYKDPVIRATNILISAIRFKNTLERNLLEPLVVYHGGSKSKAELFERVDESTPTTLASYIAYGCNVVPLDMSQFKYLFSSTRIPEKNKDSFKKFQDSKHVLIMKNGNFYVFDVYDNDGNIFPPSVLHACVRYVYEDKSPQPKHPVSILTSEDRDIWADLRNDLMETGNGRVLELIDSSILNLAFDDETVGADREKLSKVILCGDPINRWYDKAASIIITADGQAGINVEHSTIDGVTVSRFINDFLQDSMETPSIHQSHLVDNMDPTNLVRKIEFTVPSNVDEAIKKAELKYKRMSDSLQVKWFESDLIGKSKCRENNLSPDSVVQLALQIAFYIANGYIPCTSNVASTAALKYGRFDTLRTATKHTASFCEAAATAASSSYKIPNSHPSDLLRIMHECSSSHRKLCKEGSVGFSFICYFQMLDKIARESYNSTIDVLKDPSFSKINGKVIRTSTLPSPAVLCVSFVSDVPEGLGIIYSFEEENLSSTVCYNEANRNGEEFLLSLNEALGIVRSILK